jgi:nucleoid DNA-binding protein
MSKTVLEAVAEHVKPKMSHIDAFMKRTRLPLQEALRFDEACSKVVEDTLASGLGVWLPGLGGVYLFERFKTVTRNGQVEVDRRVFLRFKPSKTTRSLLKKVIDEFAEIPTEVLRKISRSGAPKRGNRDK